MSWLEERKAISQIADPVARKEALKTWEERIHRESEENRKREHAKMQQVVLRFHRYEEVPFLGGVVID